MGTRSKYTKNRNVWRRVYSTSRKKPNKETFVDGETGDTYVLDLNQTIKSRNLFRINGHTAGRLFTTGEYEETTQVVNNEDTVAFSLATTFSGDPIITLEAEPATNEPDVDVHGLSFSGNPPNLNIGLSAPFSGTIRVRAVYAASYPVAVSSAESGSFTVNAGSASIDNADSYAISYTDPSLTGATLVLHHSPWDDNSNNDISVYETNTSLTTTAATSSLSAPLNNVIHWIVAYL